MHELNKIIDRLPGPPKFKRNPVTIAGEVFEMHSRDIIECIKWLFGDPDVLLHLLLKPERHYEDATKANRVYHEMNTGRWWWTTQVIPSNVLQ